MSNTFEPEKQIIQICFEYGEGHHDLTDLNTAEKEVKNRWTKIYDITKEAGEDILFYHIEKIRYMLTKENSIQYLKIYGTNLKTGKKVTMLDTESEPDKPKPLEGLKDGEKEIDFQNDEEIVNIHFFVKKNKETKLKENLKAIRIETNLGKITVIGTNDGDLVTVKDEKLETKDNIVLAICANANDAIGVTSLYCYVVDKINYGIIRNLGILELRAKLKKDKEFKEKMKNESLDQNNKFVYDICSLPDTSFFPVFSYMMSQ